MFGWAVVFLTLAIIGGIFGFARMSGPAAWVAQALCAVALLVFLVVLAVGRRRPQPPSSSTPTH
ncbi:MAG: DUF1328 domain-containing protein [Gammaproteobacteria bacterium]|jgi:uncharacterized membrane protein YtjA (UPF0391 family)